MSTISLSPAKEKFCPSGWIELYEKCHKLGSAYANFTTARRECLDMRGDLVALMSEGQIRILTHYLKFGKRYWTGYYKALNSKGEQQWKWIDGTSDDYRVNIPQGNGTALWMDNSGLGVSDVTQENLPLCYRRMINTKVEHCSESICVRFLNFGANDSGASSRQECLKKGTDIPKEGADRRIWKHLRGLMAIYDMDQPVWVIGKDNKYQEWTSVFNKTRYQGVDHGRTVFVQDNFKSFQVPQCPCKWSEWGQNCFFFVGLQVTSRSFEEAEKYCEGISSTLARIDTLDDFNFFRRDVPGLCNQRTFWIDSGRFTPTIPREEADRKQKCSLLSLQYASDRSGKVLSGDIEERDCSEKHLFICRKALQTNFPNHKCEADVFKEVCYYRSAKAVPVSEVSCTVGEPLSLSMLDVVLTNTKGTPFTNALLWNFAAPTGCLHYWIKNGEVFAHLRPQRGYPLINIMHQYNAHEYLPYICVAEKFLLGAKLGIGVGVLVVVLVLVFGIWGCCYVHHERSTRRRNEEELYWDITNDQVPVLPERNISQDSLYSLTPSDVQFNENDVYESSMEIVEPADPHNNVIPK